MTLKAPKIQIMRIKMNDLSITLIILWDNNQIDDDAVSYQDEDDKQEFMSKIDGEIDFGERYEVVGCCELSSASSHYARFKFVYFFLCVASQFGFYWITLYGTVKYGYSVWLNWYIISLMIAGLISAFMSSFMGRLSDRFGRKYIIVLSILIQSLPYVPLCVFPSKLEYFLYILPLIGVCGSIATLTGVMKSYVVDSLPKKFLISGFAKLIAIYGGAGVASSLMITVIIGNDIRNYFMQNDLIEFTTQIIMLITVGLYVFTLLMFLLFVPESLGKDLRLKYSSVNPCHGICNAISSSVVIYSALFIFFCRYSQIGMMSIMRDIFLIDFDLTNYGDIDLMTISEHNALDVLPDGLGDDLVVYGGFIFSVGVTLICAPCCIKCCCGTALANMICSMILLIMSYFMIIYLLISPREWWLFCVALVCGVFFAVGEIGFAFLNGMIAKFINSKQYGIAYGLLHSVYSLSSAAAPYTFFILFDTLTQSKYILHEMAFGKAKSVVYCGIILALIGTMIAVFALRKSMTNYALKRENSNNECNVHAPHDYASNDGRFDEGAPGEAPHVQIMQVPMDPIQPPPIYYQPQHNAANLSIASSNYVVGQQAPGYENKPYIAPDSHHQPQWNPLKSASIADPQYPPPHAASSHRSYV